jgi:non-ribosomal peptide synthetase component E (peptide arylation enzyme)
MDQLPETPLGKIDKKLLRAQHWTDNTRNVA